MHTSQDVYLNKFTAEVNVSPNFYDQVLTESDPGNMTL